MGLFCFILVCQEKNQTKTKKSRKKHQKIEPKLKLNFTDACYSSDLSLHQLDDRSLSIDCYRPPKNEKQNHQKTKPKSRWPMLLLWCLPTDWTAARYLSAVSAQQFHASVTPAKMAFEIYTLVPWKTKTSVYLLSHIKRVLHCLKWHLWILLWFRGKSFGLSFSQ